MTYRLQDISLLQSRAIKDLSLEQIELVAREYTFNSAAITQHKQQQQQQQQLPSPSPTTTHTDIALRYWLAASRMGSLEGSYMLAHHYLRGDKDGGTAGTGAGTGAVAGFNILRELAEKHQYPHAYVLIHFSLTDSPHTHKHAVVCCIGVSDVCVNVCMC